MNKSTFAYAPAAWTVFGRLSLRNRAQGRLVVRVRDVPRNVDLVRVAVDRAPYGHAEVAPSDAVATVVLESVPVGPLRLVVVMLDGDQVVDTFVARALIEAGEEAFVVCPDE